MSDNIDNFVFSVDVGKQSKQSIELHIRALEERVDNILRKTIIDDVSIVSAVLSFTTNPDNLRLISKALERLADILPELEQLRSRHSFIEDAIKNPHWVAATFADLSFDVEQIMEIE